jgi:Ca-activated chloride channel homolog
MRRVVCDQWYEPKVHKRTFVRLLLVASWLVLPSGLGEAQDAGLSIEPRLKPDQRVSIHVNSDLVQIPVTVLDRDRRPLVGLQRENFTLFDDKAKQIITRFAIEDAPLSVGFVFDTSASMRDKMQTSRKAVTTFLKTANPDDEFFLVRVSDLAELEVGLTKNTDEIHRRLMFMQSGGRTALLDAIHFSIRLMKEASNVKKALIIISDGGDNCSRYTESALTHLVREADVQIYAMGIFDPAHIRSQIREEANGPELLRAITRQSGGRLFEIDSPNQLPELASKIGEALRAQYMLGYSPHKPQRGGKYHHVEVKLSPPQNSPRLQVSWRRGYYSPVE